MAMSQNDFNRGIAGQQPRNSYIPPINYQHPQQPQQPYVNNQYGYVNQPSYNLPPQPQPVYSQSNGYILSRPIQNENDINAGEVAMDGSVTLFPSVDGKKIFAKFWNKDGQIKTVIFCQQQMQETSDQDSNDILAPVIERLDKIERMLHNRRRSNYRKENVNDAT